jgi:GT2 family glycosyltransferase
MLVSICVGSVRGNTLPHLVASIMGQEFPDWELVIAVQGRDPTLLSYLASLNDPRISYVVLERFGKAYALNQAVKAARGDILVFTDDDCVASPDWLATIVNCFAQERDVGIVAGNVIAAPSHGIRFSTCPATYTIEYIYRPAEENYSAPLGFYWAGGNFAVRRQVMDEIGPFDEYLGPGTEFPGAEDIDFALRAEALGVVVWTTPRSIIYHTFGRRYGFRNVLKHHRAYALGSGALRGKLKLWDHRLARIWDTEVSMNTFIASFIRGFPHSVLEAYKYPYYRAGLLNYLAKFELDNNKLSRPKHVHTS